MGYRIKEAQEFIKKPAAESPEDEPESLHDEANYSSQCRFDINVASNNQQSELSTILNQRNALLEPGFVSFENHYALKVS